MRSRSATTSPPRRQPPSQRRAADPREPQSRPARTVARAPVGNGDTRRRRNRRSPTGASGPSSVAVRSPADEEEASVRIAARRRLEPDRGQKVEPCLDREEPLDVTIVTNLDRL